MSFSKRTFPTLIRAGIAVLVLGAALLAVSCGKNGSIYGAVGADATPHGFVGGFPSNISPGVYYKVSEGTYEVQYYIFDGASYSLSGNC